MFSQLFVRCWYGKTLAIWEDKIIFVKFPALLFCNADWSKAHPQLDSSRVLQRITHNKWEKVLAFEKYWSNKARFVSIFYNLVNYLIKRSVVELHNTKCLIYPWVWVRGISPSPHFGLIKAHFLSETFCRIYFWFQPIKAP